MLTVLFIALTLFKRHLGKKEEKKRRGGGRERNNMTSFTIAIAYILLRCGAFIRQHLKKRKKKTKKEERKEIMHGNCVSLTYCDVAHIQFSLALSLLFILYATDTYK